MIVGKQMPVLRRARANTAKAAVRAISGGVDETENAGWSKSEPIKGDVRTSTK